MPIPTQTDMFSIVLKIMDDGVTRSNKEIQEVVVAYLGLTPEELEPTTSSGVPIYISRSAWSVQYLQRAQLLDRVNRGVYRINDEGKKIAARNLNSGDFSRLIREMIAERNPWYRNDDEGESANSEEIKIADEADAVSPQESIEHAISNLQSTLADELLDLIMTKPPQFFEKLVVDLLMKMGYGKGEVTQYVNDGGIDGIITTDALGFDPIYTQAKRYTAENKVGRPEIQSFAGALGHYTRGVFITTSSFAKNAIDYARTYPHATIVLIDGRKLAQLMIDHDLGVSTERTYRVKRIDIDYFDQD